MAIDRDDETRQVAKVVVDESVDTSANIAAHIADDERAAVDEGQKVRRAGVRDHWGRGVERGGDSPIVAAPLPADAERGAAA
jgi:hypothetical protein